MSKIQVIGQYAVNNSSEMPWLQKPAAKKGKKAPPIKYPQFLRMAKSLEDDYWRQIFEQMAVNKCPRGFTLRDGALNHRRGQKINNIPIDGESVSDIIDFYKNMAGLRSKMDLEREQAEIEEQLANMGSLEDCTWASIKKKKKVRDLLLSSFYRDLSKTMNLNSAEKNHLISLVNLGIMKGYLNDIVMDHGRIVEIGGLRFDSGSRSFSLDNAPDTAPEFNVYTGSGLDPAVFREHFNRPDVPDCHSFLAMWRDLLDQIYSNKLRKIKKPRVGKSKKTSTETTTKRIRKPGIKSTVTRESMTKESMTKESVKDSVTKETKESVKETEDSDSDFNSAELDI